MRHYRKHFTVEEARTLLPRLRQILRDVQRRRQRVVETDEAPVHLLFLWDSTDLDPWVTATDAAGRTVGTYSLARSNRVTLSAPGRYVMMLSARSGAGHWLCVLLSGRQWDTGP